ncbi:undecaprenyl-diphosphate phosphatase [Roseitranquillus sediminis]|uniref:undecaprenyl-diphosphate phosphatase n=1 Tax=Roseitranquillus sediminis TaxID=2809051 RepID=UPI001D0C7BEA|nr:undecaprenyl-diphosphate phosphatase [Roseitranquillus sediminis]MBM9593790.1 undecaprenyl-diphosphate phosphatase [Roseitranquillus sediminis]
MPVFHLLLVAVIQGITEFLPVSSSGHLILLPNLTGLADQGQAIDVAVHVGTLGAVVLYFWRDLAEAATGSLRLLTGRIDTRGAFLALCLLVATIPVVLLGGLLKLADIDEALRSTAVIGWTMLIFGIVLWWADRTGPTARTAERWTLRDAVSLGLWQAIALIPGTSRSGIVITGARYLGYDRHGAAKVAMLMSVPTILASGVLLGAEVAASADLALARDAAIAAAFAFAAALLALAAMFRLLRSVSFTPYVVYRIALGLVLLGIAYA